MKREQALALKKELEDGLEKWSKQVLEVQENNLRRAEDKVEDRNKLKDRDQERREGVERREFWREERRARRGKQKR